MIKIKWTTVVLLALFSVVEVRALLPLNAATLVPERRRPLTVAPHLACVWVVVELDVVHLVARAQVSLAGAELLVGRAFWTNIHVHVHVQSSAVFNWNLTFYGF